MTILDASGRDPEADDYARMMICWLSDKRTVLTIVKRRRATMKALQFLHAVLCEHVQTRDKELLKPDSIRTDMLNILEDRTVRMTIARKVALDELEEHEKDPEAWEDTHPGFDPADTRRIRDTLQNIREALDKKLNSLIVQP